MSFLNRSISSLPVSDLKPSSVALSDDEGESSFTPLSQPLSEPVSPPPSQASNLKVFKDIRKPQYAVSQKRWNLIVEEVDSLEERLLELRRLLNHSNETDSDDEDGDLEPTFSWRITRNGWSAQPYNPKGAWIETQENKGTEVPSTLSLSELMTDEAMDPDSQ